MDAKTILGVDIFTEERMYDKGRPDIYFYIYMTPCHLRAHVN